MKKSVPLDDKIGDYNEKQDIQNHNHQSSEIYQTVMSLEEKYSIPIYLYYYEGYTTSEIAAMLNTNPSTIQTRLAKARKLLKMELKGESL